MLLFLAVLPNHADSKLRVGDGPARLKKWPKMVMEMEVYWGEFMH